MKTKKKADKAFTLAEVLITLTIIGVIAAITVPVLVQKTQKQEYVSALQKAYSTLSQVTNQIIAENGSPKCSDGGWACTDEDIYNMYKKYINNLKECGVSDRCFETPSSAASWWEKSFFASSNAPRFIMADGVHVMIEFSGSNSYKSCMWVTTSTAAATSATYSSP